MSGLLHRARTIRSPFPDSGSGRIENTSLLEIEEFDDPSSLKISSRILENHHGGFQEKQFLSSVQTIEDGVELPARFFETVMNHLHGTGGALLLLDGEDKVFAPWVSHGLDETTTHRLRLSGEILENFQDGLSGPLLVQQAALTPYRPFFSIRLYDQLESLVLAPVYHRETLIAVLILLDMDFESEESLIKSLETVGSAGSRLLGESRFLNFSSGSRLHPALPREELFQTIDENIERILSQNRKLSLILLDLKEILDFLSLENRSMDLFRARKDILAILDSMVSGIGEVMSLDDSKALLLLSSKTVIKDRILINQIQLSLQSFFQHRDSFPPIQARVFKIPEDGMESRALLESLV